MGAVTGEGDVTELEVGDIVRIVEKVNKVTEDDFHFTWNRLGGEKLGFSIDLTPKSKEAVETGSALIVTEVKNGRPVGFKKIRFE